MKILLNILGVLLYFLIRFNGREDKVKEPSLSFWIKDNWVEFIIIGGFDLAFMLLTVYGGLKIDFAKLDILPAWISFTGDLIVCFVIGLVGAFTGYSLVKKKLIDKNCE